MVGFFVIFCIVAAVQVTSAFNSLRSPLRNARTSLSMAQKEAYQLVLLRHGESSWNKENKFTGWYDCPLSESGHAEAAAAGKLLKDQGFVFDVAYTSYLKRAIRTLWHTLEQTDLMYIPVIHAWQLNERHYGALQGLDKQETVDKYGKDQVNVWRRSYDVPPPDVDSSNQIHCPANDPMYKDIPEAAAIRAESLKITLERVLPYFDGQVVPMIKSGKRVVIAAHGNSLRALVKYLDNIPEDSIAELNIPTGVPLIYSLDENMKPIPHADAIAPLQGRYVGNQEDIRNRIMGVKNQTK
jgi:2,3-bisphosphoglycerate-dependent phosphoglycerate mutase